MLRRRRRAADSPLQEVDLAGLEPRWRTRVEETLASRSRLRSLVEQCRAGPLQERLASLAGRVDAGVIGAWKIASRAQAASRTIDSMNLDQVHQQLKEARRRLASAQAGGGNAATV
jgi:hypothetical protein